MGVRIVEVVAVAVGIEALGSVGIHIGHGGHDVVEGQVDRMLGVGHGGPGGRAHGGGSGGIYLDYRAVQLTLDADYADVRTAGVLGIPLGALEAGAGQLEYVLNGDLLVGLIEQVVAGVHVVVARGGGSQQHMAIPGAAVRAGVQVALAHVGGEYVEVAVIIVYGLTVVLSQLEEVGGVNHGLALYIALQAAQHALVAEYGHAVIGHLYGYPLMAGDALQVPGLVLVGDHEGVGLGGAVLFHYLAVVLQRLAHVGGGGGDIAAYPGFGRAVLGVGVGGLHGGGGIGGNGAGHGQAALVGHRVVPQTLNEGGGGVLIGGVGQRNLYRAVYGNGAAGLVAVGIYYLLALRGVPGIYGMANHVSAVCTGILANIVAGARERAGAGQNHDDHKRQAYDLLKAAVHGVSPPIILILWKENISPAATLKRAG